MGSKTDWPPEVAVGRFFSFFLAGGLSDAGREKLHSHMQAYMQAWFIRQRRLR